MDFKWQISRKIDRLDLGSFAAIEFFYRTAIIFGLVRAMDPKEKDREGAAAAEGEREISSSTNRSA